MLANTKIRSFLCVGLLAAVSWGTVACGGAQQPAANVVQVQPGPLPDGGDWEGVYYNQLYGFLHLTVSSGAAQGAWRTTAGDKWGEMYGEIEGDLMRFTWKEHKVGVVGPQATSQGKGYFRYTIPREGEAHELQGEWGLGESNSGHNWNCVKQLNQEPNPKSVRPNEIESQVGASGFDGAKGDEVLLPAEPEPPAAEPTEE